MKISRQLANLQDNEELQSVKFRIKEGQSSSKIFNQFREGPVQEDYELKLKYYFPKNEVAGENQVTYSNNQFSQDTMINQSNSVSRPNRQNAVFSINSAINHQIINYYRSFFDFMSTLQQDNSCMQNLQLPTRKITQNYKMRKYEQGQIGRLRKITEKDQENQEIDNNLYIEQLKKKVFDRDSETNINPQIHRLRNKSIVGKISKVVDRKDMFGSCWQKKYRSKTQINQKPFLLPQQANQQHLPIKIHPLDSQLALIPDPNDQTPPTTETIYSQLSCITFQRTQISKCQPVISFGLETIKFKNQLIKQKIHHMKKQTPHQMDELAQKNFHQQTGKKVIKIRNKLMENVSRYQPQQEALACCFSGCVNGCFVPTTIKKQQSQSHIKRQTQNGYRNCYCPIFSQFFTSQQIKNSIASTNVKTSSVQQDCFINDSNQLKQNSLNITKISKQHKSYSFTNMNRLTRTKLQNRFNQNRGNRTYNSNCSSPGRYSLESNHEMKEFRKQTYLNF